MESQKKDAYRPGWLVLGIPSYASHSVFAQRWIRLISGVMGTRHSVDLSLNGAAGLVNYTLRANGSGASRMVDAGEFRTV